MSSHGRLTRESASSDDGFPAGTVAITGASGFVGQHLVRSLLRLSGVQIRLLVHRSVPETFNSNDRVSLFHGSLLESHTLSGFVQSGDTVINLAWLASASPAENLRCAASLADACLANGAAGLIHCSTAVVVGRCRERVVRESTECHPVTPYETSKLAVEQMLLERCRQALPIAVLRPTAVFGPGGRNLVKLAEEVSGGNSLRNCLLRSIHGTRRMNAVSVDNVVAAIEFLIPRLTSINGQVFHISDDEYPENNYVHIADYLSARLGQQKRQMPRVPIPGQVLGSLLRLAGRSNSDPQRIWDSSRLTQAGFVKPVTFEQSLARFADWFEQSRLKRCA